MAYLLLINEPIGQRAERGLDQGHEVYDRMVAFSKELKARGVLEATQSLKSSQHGKQVQVRGGRVMLTDGPFAEAKEMVGGFFLLNCKTEDEALAIATACPAAEWATVEVREIAPCYED